MIQVGLSLLLTRLHKEFEMTPHCVTTLKRYLYEIWRHLYWDLFRFRREVWRANPARSVGFKGVQNKLTGLAIIFGWFLVFQKLFRTILATSFRSLDGQHKTSDLSTDYRCHAALSDLRCDTGDSLLRRWYDDIWFCEQPSGRTASGHCQIAHEAWECTLFPVSSENSQTQVLCPRSHATMLHFSALAFFSDQNFEFSGAASLKYHP
jgi:hypothetical protein